MYAIDDPEPRRPQAIPAAVVATVAASSSTVAQRAIVGQLVMGAFFFAMQSCEY
jgi:hypothetical protein